MALPGKKRRVLIVVENLPVPFDRRVWQEARTLVAAGYEVNVICPKGKDCPASFEVIEGVHIFRHPMAWEGNGAFGYAVEYLSALFWQLVLAFRVSRRRGFDVIHACNPPDTIFLVSLVFKVFGKRFLFDHHDINPELYLAKFGRKDLFYFLVCWLERLTFKCADVTISTNESYKKIAIERGGMDESRVFVVRSGPDLARVKVVPPKPELKKGRTFLVGYVGVLGKQEGIDLLLRAIRHIVFVNEVTDIHFGIVGGGTELNNLRRYAVELGVEDFVTFTGRVSDAELLDMLNTADICVNPDIGNEMNDKSTMNKIMEYMALGKPIVQFNLTEGRFSAQESSLYAVPNDHVDFAEKILSLLGDPEARKSMGEFGRMRVENELEWRFEAPKLLRAYDAVFAESSNLR